MPTDSGDHVPIIMCYSVQASNTIISPTDVVLRNSHFDFWMQSANCYTGQGYVKFFSASGLCSSTVHLTMHDNLWFLRHQSNHNPRYLVDTINSLKSDNDYKLWHHRLGHPGSSVMSKMFHSCDCTPFSFKMPSYFSCKTCNKSKFHRHVKN